MSERSAWSWDDYHAAAVEAGAEPVLCRCARCCGEDGENAAEPVVPEAADA